jgi:hypothetical protein
MEKQMINGFLIPLAHPTPVNHHHILLSQIVLHKNFAKGGRPNKESHSRRGFSAPYALPRKRASSFRNNLVVKRSHLKLSFSVRNPPNLVTPTNQVKGVKKTIKRSQLFHFPIIQGTDKTNIPLTRTTHQIRIVRNIRILSSFCLFHFPLILAVETNILKKKNYLLLLTVS